jgi:hypothetical protein
MCIGLPEASVWVSVTSQKAGSPVSVGCPGELKLPLVFSDAESTVTWARCSADCR